jgi:hypothetical protein
MISRPPGQRLNLYGKRGSGGFCSEERNQATAKLAFGFNRAKRMEIFDFQAMHEIK